MVDIHIQKRGNMRIIYVSGDIHRDDSDVLTPTLQDIFDTTSGAIVMSLEEVTDIGDRQFEEIVDFEGAMSGVGRPLRVCGSEAVYTRWQAADLDTALELYETLNDAVMSLSE